MIHRARAELDCKWDGSRLGELVTVQAKLEAGLAARAEIPARVVDVECAALEKDIRRLGEPGGVGKDFSDEEVDIGGGAGVGELGRDGMRTEPGGSSACRPNRTKLGKLRLAIEPVSRLCLERRRPGATHPGNVTLERRSEPGLAGLPRRADRRQDAPSRRMQLLVAGTRCTQRELRDPVAREARMGVAVDEPWDRRESPAVELLDLAGERLELAH